MSGRRIDRVCRTLSASCVLTAIICIFVLVPATDASAKKRTGVLAGTIDGLPRKGKRAKRTIALQFVNVETAVLAKSVELTRSRFSVKLPSGIYLLSVSSFDYPGKATAGTARLVRVVKGRKVRKNVRVRRIRKKKKRAAASTALRTPLAGVRAAAADPNRMVLGVDPNITVTGINTYPNGLDLDGVVITDLFSKECKDGPDYDVVEIRHRNEIIKEIERSNGPGFDPATRVPRGHLVEARQMVKGGGTIANGRASLQISVVDVATGEVIASAAVEGAETDFFKLLDDLTTAMMKDLCAPRVDVTFAGSATYTRDEGASALDSQDHVQSAYNWSINYHNVRLGGPAGTMNFASVSQVDGNWSDVGRYGPSPFGDYQCSGPVIGSNGNIATVQVEKTVNGFRIAAQPFFMAQNDLSAVTCSGLSGPPYRSFFMSGTERATQALVDIDPVALRAAPLQVAVGPSQPYPTDCSNLLGAYYPPCSESFNWSGNVTVTRLDP